MTASGARDEVATVDDAVALRTVIGRLWRQVRLSAGGELTPSQSSALARLDRDGPMRLGALAAAEGMSASTVSRIVASLEGPGYVERLADATDRRASPVRRHCARGFHSTADKSDASELAGTLCDSNGTSAMPTNGPRR